MLVARAVAAGARVPGMRALSTTTWATAEVVGEGNQTITTVATLGRHSFKVDTPSSEGGRGSAASPAQHLLGSLVGCQQAALHLAAGERKVELLLQATQKASSV